MKDEFKLLMDYVHKIEDKYGTVTLMDKKESSYMQKLSNPCYRNEYANLNQYEVTVIKKYLSGEIIVRQLAYYLNTTDGKALKMATLYAKGRYELTNHKNYWELRR